MKMTALAVIGIIATGLVASPVAALTIVECIDENGDSSFRDRCPPGMTERSKQEYRERAEDEESGPDTAAVAREHPVVLFVAPNCNACDLVRNVLETRSIPYAEKDASTDPAVQAELAAVTEGPLTVPTVTIGELKFSGYNKIELDSALSNVGFP